MSRGQSYSFFIIKLIFYPSGRTQSLYARGSLDSYILYDLFLYTPNIFLFWWMVDGLHFNYDATNWADVLWYQHQRGWTPGSLCTQAVCRRPTRETINPKEPKVWTPSTTHYPQNIIKVFGRIVRSYSNTRKWNGSLAEWLRAFLTNLIITKSKMSRGQSYSFTS